MLTEAKVATVNNNPRDPSIHLIPTLGPKVGKWGTVKIMVPFWVPIIIRGTGPNLGDPKRDHNFDNSPNVTYVGPFLDPYTPL